MNSSMKPPSRESNYSREFTDKLNKYKTRCMCLSIEMLVNSVITL